MSETGRKLQSNSSSIHLESHVQGTVLSDSKHKILLLSNLLIEFQVKNWGTHNKPEDRSTWASLLVKQWEEESWQQGVHHIVSIHSWQLQIQCGRERCRNLAILKGGERGGREEEPHSYCFSSGHSTHTPALPRRLLSSPRRGWCYSKRVSDTFSLLTKPFKKSESLVTEKGPRAPNTGGKYTFNSRYFRILEVTL